MEVGWGAGSYWLVLLPFESSLVWELELFRGSVVAAWELTVNWLSGGEKICIVRSLFCVFIVIIIISSSIFPLLSY